MPSEAEGSVTRWVGELRAGELDDAARQLWGRYFDRLARLARVKLARCPARPANGEDVALGAFDSFFAGGAVAGEFPQLGGRDDPGVFSSPSPPARSPTSSGTSGSRRNAAAAGCSMREPSTGLTRALAASSPRSSETSRVRSSPPRLPTGCRRRLEGLRDASFRQVTLMRMEGYSNGEIAGHLDTNIQAVERQARGDSARAGRKTRIGNE